MLNPTAFRITKRACQIRVDAGENIADFIDEYVKLSDEQKGELLEELTMKEMEDSE